jgi:hypothetical protein
MRFLGMLTAILLCHTTHAEDEIFEYFGDHYVIHVDKLDPDPEMTLMDVLHLCPEMLSTDGNDITTNYILCIENIDLLTDWECILEQIKACELSTIDIYNYPAVSQGSGATDGIIDLYFKDPESTHGKAAIEGNTYGNGKLYADVNTKIKNVNIRAYALTHLKYGKAYATDDYMVKMRSGAENLYLNASWDISGRDNLNFNLVQGFSDEKIRSYGNSPLEMGNRQRWVNTNTRYTRTLNNQDASLSIESYFHYISTMISDVDQRILIPTLNAEVGFPLFSQKLNVIAGWEADYLNQWIESIGRSQVLNNDFYVQLDYKNGPWLFTIGDRFRVMNYWDKYYLNEDATLWSYHRSNHAWHTSVGWQKKGHFIQGVFSHDYLLPDVSDFYDDLNPSRRIYNTNYTTNLYYTGELRYTYQRKDFAVTGSLTHVWENDSPTNDRRITGFKTSATWRKGILRLTMGADFYHDYEEGEGHDNYFHLKLAPILLLGKGFRLSSVLIYGSRHPHFETHPHLYASVKVNKNIGKHCNVFVDFHDIAGQPTGTIDQLAGSYKNRALSLGATFYWGN